MSAELIPFEHASAAAEAEALNVKTVSLIARPNLFRPDTDIEAVPVGQTIEELAAPYLDAMATGTRLVCYANGQPVARRWWAHIRPKAGTYLQFHAVPQSEGGAGAMVAQIAVSAIAVAAAVAVPHLFPMLGPLATAFISAGAATAVGFAANFALSSLINSPRGGSDQQARPNAITGQRNAFPRNQPVRAVKGNVRVYPPIVGFSQVVKGDDLEAINLYVVGLGELLLDNFHFGDTPIGVFDPNHEIEGRRGIGSSQSNLTIWTNDIFEESVAQLVEFGAPVVRTTRDDTARIGVDVLFPGGLYRVDRKNKKNAVEIVVEYRQTGTTGWAQAARRTLRDNSQVPVRENFTWSVTPGQYDVRVRRTNQPSGDEIESFNFQRLRSIRRIDNPVPKEWAVVALRVNADGSLPPFNCRARSRMLDYNGTPGSWSPRVTRNPASIYRSILQDQGNANPVPDSRIDIAKLEEWHQFCADDDLFFDHVFEDEATIRQRLEQVATAGMASPTRGLDGSYSVVIDKHPGPPVAMLTPANTRNFVGSIDHTPPPLALRVKFINRNLSETRWEEDEIFVGDDGVTQANVDPGRVEVLDLTESGVTVSNHAFKLARRFIAERKLRGGEKWRVDVGIESVRLRRGQRVHWQHDVTLQAIKSSRIKTVTTDGSGNVTAITLEEAVEMTAGNDYGLRVILTKNVGGTGQTAFVDRQAATVTGVSNELDFSGDPFPASSAPAKGDLASFGLRGQETIDALIQEILPGPNLDETSLVLMRHEPAIYDPDTIPDFESDVTLIGDPARVAPPRPVIEATRLVDVIDGRELATNVRANLFVMIAQISSARPQPALVQGEIRIKDVLTGVRGSWDRFVLAGDRTRFKFPEPVDRGFHYEIRVRAVSGGNVPSPWTDPLEIDATIPGDPGINAARVTGLQLLGKPNSTEITGLDFKFVWRRNTSTGNGELTNELSSGQAFLDATFSHWQVEILDTHTRRKRRQEEVLSPHYTYLYPDNIDDSQRMDGPEAPPERAITIRVRVVDRFGRLGLPATLDVANPAPEQPQNLTFGNVGTRLRVSANEPPASRADLRGMLVWGELNADPPLDDEHLLGTISGWYGVVDGVPAGDLHLRVAFFDGFSRDPAALNVSAERTHNVSTIDFSLPEFSFDPPLTFTPNPDDDTVSWNATTANVVTDGDLETFEVAQGSASYPGSGTLYLYYVNGDGIIRETTDPTVAFATVNNRLLAQYRGGNDLFESSAVKTDVPIEAAPVPQFSFSPPFSFTTAGNTVSWASGTTATVVAGGTTETRSIDAGNAGWTGGTLYIFYARGQTVLSATTDPLTAFLDTDRTIVATYLGGNDIKVGPAHIHGSQIVAQTIGANQVVAADLITQTAQISDAIITDAKVQNLSGTKIDAQTIGANQLIATQAVITDQAQLASAIINDGHIVNLSADKLVAESILSQRIYMGSQTGSRLELIGQGPRIDVFDSLNRLMVRVGRLGSGFDGMVTLTPDGSDVFRCQSDGTIFMDGLHLGDLTVNRASINELAISNAALTQVVNVTYVDTFNPNVVDDTFVIAREVIETSASRGAYVWGMIDCEISYTNAGNVHNNDVVELRLLRTVATGAELVRRWRFIDLVPYGVTVETHSIEGRILLPIFFADVSPPSGNNAYNLQMRFFSGGADVDGFYRFVVNRFDLAILGIFK